MTDPHSNNPVAELIVNRRTIYAFRSEPVPDVAVIRQGIDVARWAPNHHLTEPWHFYFLGPETVDQVIELNAELVLQAQGEKAAEIKRQRWSQIPGWLVVSCDISADPIRAKEDYAACCCVIQNLMLYLWSREIGMKWSTGAVTRDPRFYDLVWIDPAQESVVGLFWYGYAEEIPVTVRKTVDQIIVELP